MRQQWATVFALCIVFAGALTSFGASPAVADTPAPPTDATCYRQSDLNNREWERLGWDEQSCFIADSCHGGLGGNGYGGGCYKWARGPNAPPLPWSAEVTADEPPGRPLPTDEGLPLEYGLLASHAICEETPNACPVLRWRANARVPIYAEPDPRSRRVGRINRNEVVVTLEHARFVASRRGVAVTSYYGMNEGDVVYYVEPFCNVFTVWRRGDLISAIDWDMVEFEPRQRLYNPSNGGWIRVERANGQRGWVREAVLGRYLTGAEPPPAPPATETGEYDEYDACE